MASVTYQPADETVSAVIVSEESNSVSDIADGAFAGPSAPQGTITVLAGSLASSYVGGGSFAIQSASLQYSINNGSSWTTFASVSSRDSGPTSDSADAPFSVSTGPVTPSNVQIRGVAIVGGGVGSLGSASAVVTDWEFTAHTPIQTNIMEA